MRPTVSTLTLSPFTESDFKSWEYCPELGLGSPSGANDQAQLASSDWGVSIMSNLASLPKLTLAKAC